MKKKKPKKSRKKKKESEFARKKIVNENVSDSEDSDDPPDKPPPKPINLDIIRMKCRADWLILCYSILANSASLFLILPCNFSYLSNVKFYIFLVPYKI